MSDDAKSEASRMQRSIRVLSNIRTPAASAAYDSGWERTFGKKAALCCRCGGWYDAAPEGRDDFKCICLEPQRAPPSPALSEDEPPGTANDRTKEP